MEPRWDVFAAFGLSSLPWVARVYLTLVVIFAALLLLSALPALTVHLLPVVSDGLKMVLAALLGALSQAGEVRRTAR
jgi:hypothetical protein